MKPLATLHEVQTTEELQTVQPGRLDEHVWHVVPLNA